MITALAIVGTLYVLMHVATKRAVETYDGYGQQDPFIPR